MTRMGNRILLILLILVGMGACKKDAPMPPLSGDCTPRKQFSLSYFTEDRFQFKSPSFNPNNAQEFVFQYIDFEQSSFQVRKFNLETQANDLLIDEFKVISQPKWSRSGWIALDNVFDYNVWITDEFGDGLTAISDESFNYYPCWDTLGSEVYYRSTPTQGHPYYLLRANIYNSLLDTVLFSEGENYGFTSLNDVSIQNEIASITLIKNSLSIGVSNLNELLFENGLDMRQTFDIEMPTGLCWNADGSKIFISIHDNGLDEINGLFEVDISTGQVLKLMDYCWDRQYSHISASPDGKYLIGERIDSYYRLNDAGEPYGNIAENSSIYLIDLETLEETKIDIE